MKRSLFLLAAIATVVALAPKPGYAHRYFDTWAARWTTPDPALNANPQIVVKKHGYRIFEVSPYVYCSDNPIKYVDPNGKQGGLSLGGPILLPTSLRQLEYNVVATLTASAVTAGIVYAPGVTATLVGKILGNPATAAAITTGAAQVLMPGTEGNNVETLASGVSKSEALSVVTDNLEAGSEQLKAALTDIRNGVLKESYSVDKLDDGIIRILKERPGRDGKQVIETLIQSNGGRQITQRAYNAAGQLVHDHVWKAFGQRQ